MRDDNILIANRLLEIHGNSAIPFVGLLGFERVVTEGAGGEVAMAATCRPELADGSANGSANDGALHSGVLTALADTAFGLALLSSSLPLAGFATIDLSVEHATPPEPGRSVIVHAAIDEVVNGVASLSGRILDADDGRPVATARAGFALLAPGMSGAVPEPGPSAPTPPFPDDRPLDGVPYATLLGLRRSGPAGRPLCRMPFRPELVGSPRLDRLHGGALAGLLEITAGLVPDAQVLRTRSSFIDFLRPAGPFDTFAGARAATWNGTMAEIEVEAWQFDPTRPIATATVVLETMTPEGAA